MQTTTTQPARKCTGAEEYGRKARKRSATGLRSTSRYSAIRVGMTDLEDDE